ncbi:MAG TPA: DUF2269 family protein [Acidimicrobiia bacterium]|nr:DUF2269 family protein [Acidimicrobiia bacterium]
MRTVTLWLHIMGGGTWLGANLAQLTISRGMLSGEAGTARRFMETVHKMTNPLYGTASVVILVTGVILVLTSGGTYSFGSVFVGLGIAVLVIGGALGGLVFSRKTKEALALYEAGEAASTAPLHRSIAFWGRIDTLLIALAMLAMVAKWGA